MKEPSSQSNPFTPRKRTSDEIAAVAYRLYVESGRLEGRDQENWLKAEKILTEKLEPYTTEVVKASHAESGSQLDVRPAEPLKHPFARDTHGSATREDVRRQTTQMRPAARQYQRQP